ncbi:MAG: heavy-metal-associated domain-containing protein [archaeon]
MQIKLHVSGMHCKSCVMLIEDSLTEAGADKVDASYKAGRVTVDFDPGRISEDRIKQVIKSEGYGVEND